MVDPYDLVAMQRVLVGEPVAELVEMEARIRAAQLAADVESLDALISDDLLFTGPDGQLGTKEADLAAHQSGVVRFVRHDPIELRIRLVGPDVAVTALSTVLEVEVGGVRTGGSFRYTRVWAREGDGSWRVVGGHVSEVPEGTSS